MKLYNTLTRKKEEFVPITPNKVKMYNCGPTVYNYIHAGNARPLVVFDTLRRFFISQGYVVDFVVNFTDIDDKLIRRAEEEGTTVYDIANRYIEEFKKDANGLRLYDYNTINPRATEYIQPIIDFIQGLMDKGAAYVSGSDVYFNIEAAKDYGKLSKKKLDELVSGARIDVNEMKNHPGDFVLWKGKKPGEPFWESPWGDGRPGWHIECSVMAKSLLGETIDIHSGGEDLQFPHHENEIAQSETLTEKPFANYWLHNGMITVDNEKMSKSKGNFFTVREVSEEYDLEILRFFLLSSHYRSPINFSRDVMDQMEHGLERMYNGKEKLLDLLEHTEERDETEEDQKQIDQLVACKDRFVEAMEDDLNTADAISEVFQLVRLVNTDLSTDSNKKVVEVAYQLLMELTQVLGLLHRKEEEVEPEILQWIKEREEARKNKDFARSDEIRDLLKEKGYAIEDTRTGTKWKRI